jgi:hypothetical protein
VSLRRDGLRGHDGLAVAALVPRKIRTDRKISSMKRFLPLAVAPAWLYLISCGASRASVDQAKQFLADTEDRLLALNARAPLLPPESAVMSNRPARG